MAYQVQVQQVAARTTAVVRRRASFRELAKVIPEACGEVWAFLGASKVPHTGLNLVVYLDQVGNLECGAEVTQPFAGDGRVVCSRTPAGTVATTTHLGPHDCLHDAHAAIRRWCAANGHALAGVNWELYGHGNSDPAKLRTDVYYLLKAADESAAYRDS